MTCHQHGKFFPLSKYSIATPYKNWIHPTLTAKFKKRMLSWDMLGHHTTIFANALHPRRLVFSTAKIHPVPSAETPSLPMRPEQTPRLAPGGIHDMGIMGRLIPNTCPLQVALKKCVQTCSKCISCCRSRKCSWILISNTKGNIMKYLLLSPHSGRKKHRTSRYPKLCSGVTVRQVPQCIFSLKIGYPKIHQVYHHVPHGLSNCWDISHVQTKTSSCWLCIITTSPLVVTNPHLYKLPRT